MITVRAGPNSSLMAGPICQTQYMFIPTCSRPACSQPALSTVHQRPYPNTGAAPLAPNQNNTTLLGESAENRLPPPMLPPEKSNVISHSVTHAPTTIGAKP